MIAVCIPRKRTCFLYKENCSEVCGGSFHIEGISVDVSVLETSLMLIVDTGGPPLNVLTFQRPHLVVMTRPSFSLRRYPYTIASRRSVHNAQNMSIVLCSARCRL